MSPRGTPGIWDDLGAGGAPEPSQGCDYPVGCGIQPHTRDRSQAGNGSGGGRGPGRGQGRGRGSREGSGVPAHHDAGLVGRQGVDGQAAAHQVLADPRPLGRVPRPPSLAPGGASWGWGDTGRGQWRGGTPGDSDTSLRGLSVIPAGMEAWGGAAGAGTGDNDPRTDGSTGVAVSPMSPPPGWDGLQGSPKSASLTPCSPEEAAEGGGRIKPPHLGPNVRRIGSFWQRGAGGGGGDGTRSPAGGDTAGTSVPNSGDTAQPRGGRGLLPPPAGASVPPRGVNC